MNLSMSEETNWDYTSVHLRCNQLMIINQCQLACETKSSGNCKCCFGLQRNSIILWYHNVDAEIYTVGSQEIIASNAWNALLHIKCGSVLFADEYVLISFSLTQTERHSMAMHGATHINMNYKYRTIWYQSHGERHERSRSNIQRLSAIKPHRTCVLGGPLFGLHLGLKSMSNENFKCDYYINGI